MKRRGFTLVEVMAACVVLSLALLVCFELFQWCSRAALLGQSRAGLESEGRRVLLAVRLELLRSDFAGLETITTRTTSNPEGQTVDRHALSLLCLSNWNNPASFNTTSAAPLWDRYMVLYANLANPGLLIKQYYAPAGAPYRGPMGNLAGLLNDNPAANLGSKSYQVLAQDLESFQVTSDDLSKVVQFNLTLARRGARKADRASLNERHQLNLAVPMENSGP